MARRFDRRSGSISIVGLIAAVIILYFLFHQGYLGNRSNVLTPPTNAPRLP